MAEQLLEVVAGERESAKRRRTRDNQSPSWPGADVARGEREAGIHHEA
jgi:hypothetical protein